MSRNMPIRVMIVDDHSMVRKGLALILKLTPGLELVGEASDGQEALELCGQAKPDVILMDLVMPELDGAAATRAIRNRYPETQVIALTSFKEKELVQRALEAGAISYLLKNVSADELTGAIQAAYAGRSTLAPEVAEVLTQAKKLELLARALVDAVPDGSVLPDLLQEHVPDMFPEEQVEIRLFPEQVLFQQPAGSPVSPPELWSWLSTALESHCFVPGAELPWQTDQQAVEGLVVAPMQTVDNPAPIGGIFVAKSRDAGAVADLLPVVKSLAAQIASAIQMAQIHAQTVAHERLERELAMAGQIQASFLPTSLPRLAGWDLAVTLEPARVASGDFYDFIPLSDDRLGIVIADVSDKGMGAALYMALARTLLRTYASEYPDQPDRVLDATNRRILGDAGAGLFVTVFYAALDPASGWLTYCNAGHPPPLLYDPKEPTQIAELGRTGMALGAVEDTSWRQRTVRLEPGQVLLLYSDGISDAQDPERQLYGRERLRSFLAARAPTQRPRGPSAQFLLDSLLVEVHEFMGSAAQFDDIALSVLVRST